MSDRAARGRTTVRSVYRSPAGRERVRAWCETRIGSWSVPHRRSSLATTLGDTHVLTTGDADPSVVLLPGTNVNAATTLAFAAELAERAPTAVVDLPGQPGLSTGDRPRADPLPAYGRWLGEVLDEITTGPVTVVGHSLGGGVALASDSARIAARLLIAPAGLVRLRVTPTVLAATLPWLARPSARSSARLLGVMHGSGYRPGTETVEWMTIVARECRTSLAPSPLPRPVLEAASRVPALVATGQDDVFLPPGRLAPAAQRSLGVPVRVLHGLGHLAPEEEPARVAALLDEIPAV